MCGLFGFVSRGQAPDLKTLAQLATLAETRGPHAFGLGWVQDDRIAVYKRPGNLTHNLGLLSHTLSSPVMIGIARLATFGDWQDNRNNQPIGVGPMAVAVNGNIYNASRIFRDYRYKPVSANDSEALLAVALNAGIHTVLSKVDDTPLAAMFLSKRELVLLRTGSNPHPLYVEQRAEGFYFCSRRMSADSTLLPEGMVATYDALN